MKTLNIVIGAVVPLVIALLVDLAIYAYRQPNHVGMPDGNVLIGAAIVFAILGTGRRTR